MTIQEILRCEPLFQNTEVKFSPVEGGLVNQSYRITCANGDYYLRIYGAQADYLGLDRTLEEQACRQAGRLGISPTVRKSAGTGYLITDFFPGRPLDGKAIHRPEILRQVIAMVKAIHTKMDLPRAFSAFDLIDRYVQQIRERHVATPPGFGQILDQVDKIRVLRSADKEYSRVFCHNDVWINNLLYDGERLIIVDWELCGYGDAYFDLARIAYLENTSVQEEKRMLEQYFGFFEEEMLHTLQQMKYVGMVSEAVWAFFHSSIQDDGHSQTYDYTAFAKEVIRILESGANHF